MARVKDVCKYRASARVCALLEAGSDEKTESVGMREMRLGMEKPFTYRGGGRKIERERDLSERVAELGLCGSPVSNAEPSSEP